MNTTVKVLIPALDIFFAEVLNDTDLSHHYAAIIQLGSWDLNSHTFGDVIYKWLPRFRDALQQMYSSKKGQFPRLKVLVMSSPSLPDAEPGGSHTLQRNNWISAVLANTLRRHMKQIGVDYLDEFSFTFPLYWYTCSWPVKPNHHYAMWGHAKRQQCNGPVGHSFMALFTSKICPDLDFY